MSGMTGDDAQAPATDDASVGPSVPASGPAVGSSAGSSLGPPVQASSRPPLRQRLSELFAQYGKIAIYTYFTLSILTIIGFSVAIGIGAEPSTATGVLGVIAAGWVAAKATLPIRILVTLGLTPMVAFVARRVRKPDEDELDDAPDDEADDEADPPAPT
jgi:hypothetical protein